jgi:hypothetical protein
VPVSAGLAKAAAAVLGKTTISKDSSSSSSKGAGTEQQQEQQQAMQEAVEQKQDRQQQAQQGDAAADDAGRGDRAGREGRQLVCLAVKAMDAHFSSQPSEVGSIWNIRGVGNNAWHRVEVYV